MYDMVVLAIPVAFLVRLGLKSGFRPYELPALGVALALFFSFIFFGFPIGPGDQPDRRGPRAAPGRALVAAEPRGAMAPVGA